MNWRKLPEPNSTEPSAPKRTRDVAVLMLPTPVVYRQKRKGQFICRVPLLKKKTETSNLSN